MATGGSEIISAPSFSLSGPVSSEHQLFYAVSVFATRPHILNRNVKGAELVQERLKFFSETKPGEEVEVPWDVVSLLKEPFLKSTVEELRDLDVGSFVLWRNLIGHSLRDYLVKETWDLVGQRVCVESFDEPNKELPPMRLAFCLSKPSLDEQIVEVLCSCGIWEGPGSALMERSLRFYELKVVPRIITWCEASNSVAVESRPNQAPGVPSTSLKFVPVKSYFEVYKRLKDTYFARLQSLWTENTDPLKFITEEMGIAAYVSTYITSNCPDPSFSFVDMGCGNGMLTFSLAALGASGFGFDIRSRKLWDVFPQLGIFPDLRILSFNPFSDEIQPQNNLWLIGNHADELTPWISVMARKFNAQGFIVIPCCLFDFHGKFQRRAKNSSDSESLYQNYIHYICEVGRRCGYSIKVDKLRIPSTKRICIIGTTLTGPDSAHLIAQATFYVQEKVSQFPTTDSSIEDIKLFKPRNPTEKVNNLTQVDRTLVADIVHRIFSHILSDPSRAELTSHPQYLQPWRRGRVDVSLPEAANLLTPSEKDAIQKQGKGIQTLLKNHNQVFRIMNSCVLLRRPVIDDQSKPSSSKGDGNDKRGFKLKTQACYFYKHHPDSCPLPTTLCRFKHEEVEVV